jgi:imidazolonepropionase
MLAAGGPQKIDVRNGTCVLQSVSCCLTMDCDREVVEDSTSPARLGIMRNVDVVITGGQIAAIGPGAAASAASIDHMIDGRRLVVMPGLVDASAAPLNHGVLGKETVLRSQGMSSAELQKSGLAGSRARQRGLVRSADDWHSLLHQFLHRSLETGVMVQEVKTGSCAHIDELVSEWQFLCRAAESVPGVLTHLTFFGPNHPDTAGQGLMHYIERLVDLLPQIAAVGVRGRGYAVDVNVDADGFTKEMADKWLAAALQHGFDVMVHADRASRSGGAELAAELGRRQEQKKIRLREQSRILSAGHARYSSEADLLRMFQCGVSVVICPTQALTTGEDPADAPRLRASGIRVAIATGFDPLASPYHNLWLSAYAALTDARFAVPEVLAGITVEGAYALGLEKSVGRIAVGQKARLIAFEGEDPEDFFNFPLGDHLRLLIQGG